MTQALIVNISASPNPVNSGEKTDVTWSTTGASFHDEKELGVGGADFTSRGEVFNKEIYREFLMNPKVVGIGECGLDYFHMDEGSIQKQKEAFVSQIELANEVNKPLMLHIRNNKNPSASSGQETRNAYTDALELLKEHAKVKGDIHFFAGSLEDAKGFVDFGFTLSFTGVVTFSHDYDEVIRSTPIDMIMSETDSPYVSPVPHRGKRNEPVYVKEIVKKIAEIKGLSEEEVAEAIISNAQRVFSIHI